MRRWRPGGWLTGVVAVCIAVLPTFFPHAARSTPGYARRFDTACTTCHAPQPPRLNSVGMIFRRAGFRLPDANDQGALMFKSAPTTGILDAASIKAGASVSRDPEPTVGETRTHMQLDEIELVGGTSIGDHLSAQLMFLPRSEGGTAELEDVELQANVGSPSDQFIFRTGLAQTSIWQKANHGSVTLHAPLVFSEEPMAPIGGFAGFQLGVKQIEAEAGFMHTSLKKGAIGATMVSAAALNGVQQDGSASQHTNAGGPDLLLQALQVFGSQNTAGAFYYRGHETADVLGELPVPGPFRDTFTRYGVLGNYALVPRVELVASFVTGKDQARQLARDVTTRGGFAEANATLMDHWLVAYRWEALDPDIHTVSDVAHVNVLSTTCQVQEHMFLTAEYRRLSIAEEKSHGVIGSIRLIY